MAEPDNPVDFLRNRRAAAASGGGSNGAPAPAPPPANGAPAQHQAQEETFENPTHPAGGVSSLEDMEPGDLLTGVPGRSEMYEAEKPSNGGDGAAVIGGASGAPKPSSDGSSFPKLILVGVFIALIVGFVVVMSKGGDAAPAEVVTNAPLAEPVPGLAEPAPVPGPDRPTPSPPTPDPVTPPPPAPPTPTPTPALPPPATPPPPPGSRCAHAAPCPPPSGDCKISGTCMEATGLCSAESHQPAGTICDDGNPATSNDNCDAVGACSGTAAPPPAPAGAYTPVACSYTAQVAIAVRIVANTEYSDEIQWDVDGACSHWQLPAIA